MWLVDLVLLFSTVRDLFWVCCLCYVVCLFVLVGWLVFFIVCCALGLLLWCCDLGLIWLIYCDLPFWLLVSVNMDFVCFSWLVLCRFYLFAYCFVYCSLFVCLSFCLILVCWVVVFICYYVVGLCLFDLLLVWFVVELLFILVWHVANCLFSWLG